MSCREISTIGRLGVAALAALLLAALALPAAASAATDGGISGTVTLAGGGPVEKASVCAETEGEVFDFECTETAADGSYEITGLTPAKYLVFFESGASGRYLIPQYYDGASSWLDADEVTVASGVTTPGIDAALVEGGAIAGRVSDATTSVGIREVLVCVRPEAGGGSESCGETAIDGSYEIVGVPAGLNEVGFWPFDGHYEAQFLHGVAVSVGVKDANVNAALLHPEGRISGHVYAAANHEALRGVPVCAIDEFGESRGCAHTSKSGAYEFLQVPSGSWRIAFSPDPSEFEAFKVGEIEVDVWPTQFWNLKPTLAEADEISMAHAAVVTGIDALLGPGPTPPPADSGTPSSPGPASVTVTPKPRHIHCGKGKVIRRVKGKRRCVRRHKPRHRGHHGHRGHKHRHR